MEQLPADVQTLIHSYRPVHPTAKLIQALPQEAFKALHTRYAAPCWRVLHSRLSAVSRLTHMRCGFIDEGCRNDYRRTGVSRCVGDMFNAVRRAADEEQNPEFYRALQRLFDLVAP